jgi:hypothetical protein
MLDGGAIGGTVLERHDHEVAGRHLRKHAVIEVLVALVLDGDRREALVGRNGDRVGLAAEIAGCFDFLGGEIDGFEVAGRMLLVLAGVDGDQRLAAQDGDRGRLAIEHHRAECLGRVRVGNIDQANGLERARGVDERVAVFGGGDDFSRSHRLGIDVGRRVGRDRERGDAVENLLGLGKCGSRSQEGRDCRCP